MKTASKILRAYAIQIQVTMLRIVCSLGLLLPTVSSAITFNLAAGWNLVGNSNSAAIDVATAFGDASKIRTVWRWNRNASRWAFYTPSMSAESLLSYTQTMGYDALSIIESKDGFWVNVMEPTVVVGPVENGVNLTQKDIQVGWNLVSSADSKTPPQLNAALSSSLSRSGKTIESTWAWDATTSKWRFYAPAMEAQGGAFLNEFVASKGYLLFAAALSLTDGYWVNASTVPATANIAPMANPGIDQKVVGGSVVTLYGSASSDPDGDPLTYAWTLVSKPAGSTTTLISATSVNPTFTADLAGTYVANLTVDDGQLSSEVKTTNVTVVPRIAGALGIALSSRFDFCAVRGEFNVVDLGYRSPWTIANCGVFGNEGSALFVRIQNNGSSPLTLTKINVFVSPFSKAWLVEPGSQAIQPGSTIEFALPLWMSLEVTNAVATFSLTGESDLVVQLKGSMTLP
jgi:hypothetical protein